MLQIYQIAAGCDRTTTDNHIRSDLVFPHRSLYSTPSYFSGCHLSWGWIFFGDWTSPSRMIPTPPVVFLTLEGRQFSIVYTDTESSCSCHLYHSFKPRNTSWVQYRCFQHRTNKLATGIAAHFTSHTNVPPHTGCFLDARIA